MHTHKYDAFISYRNISPDRDWAVWLSNSLETARIPNPARLGTTRADTTRIRTFLDRNDMRCGPSLSEELRNALDASRFLIVIVSTKTTESAWAREEISHFERSGRADQILWLITEGDPEQIIPELLPSKHPPGQRHLLPMAADVRPRPGFSKSEIKRTAALRILASILGCDFDALRDRDRERKINRLKLAVAALSILVAIVTFLTIQALRQRNLAQSRSYDALIGSARLLIENSDYTAARQFLSNAPAAHRNWEWRYLSGLMDRSEGVVKLTTNNAPTPLPTHLTTFPGVVKGSNTFFTSPHFPFLNMTLPAAYENAVAAIGPAPQQVAISFGALLQIWNPAARQWVRFHTFSDNATQPRLLQYSPDGSLWLSSTKSFWSGAFATAV